MALRMLRRMFQRYCSRTRNTGPRKQGTNSQPSTTKRLSGADAHTQTLPCSPQPQPLQGLLLLLLLLLLQLLCPTTTVPAVWVAGALLLALKLLPWHCCCCRQGRDCQMRMPAAVIRRWSLPRYDANVCAQRCFVCLPASLFACLSVSP